MLFLDLDGFKNVNDSLGHEVGDGLLVAAAERIEASVRLGDTVARLGGDEFTVLLEDVTGVGEAIGVADRIAAKLSSPFELAGEEVLVTSSVGISVSATAHDRPEDLMREADLAMYRAKETGKAHHRVFEENMGAEARDRLKLAGDLRRAIDGDEFRIYYQPLVVLDGERRVAGMEALLRWEHPDRGLLVPSQFLPVAEETGLILPIGMWVLEEACEQANAWRKEWPEGPPPMLCVNLSAKQMQAPDLVEDVSRILARTGLPPECLDLEITGDALAGDGGALASRLRELKALGVKLTVDDLGGQDASLSLPRRLPVDFLKIDRSVIDGLGRNPEDAAVTSAFIDLADAFGVTVIAEGIENAEQISRLREMGCKLGQGYHFSPPVPVPEVPWLRALRGA
ncbi:EAL domain-containing protein [Rubrobacter marinus]|uniref:EAL domain-containing protein n=1 Tax=Rubrobacter marinus TaxID=2653852 RepID=A0A6G8Q231_9ACTN|nr:EAL domain-containing protein [Rubrobacter marinus]